MRQSRSTDRSPWRGVALLMATITATELAMLNVIFWARAEGTIPGLAVAVTTPWLAGLVAPLLWTRRRAPFHAPFRPALRPRLSLGIGLALAAALLLGRIITVA
jgi:hypothetical protein